MRIAMKDLQPDDITKIDPDDMFRRLREERVTSGLTEYPRVTLCSSWSTVRYFRSIIDEFAQMDTSPEYWRYISESLDTYERAVLAQGTDGGSRSP
jgi:hypothetical protein